MEYYDLIEKRYSVRTYDPKRTVKDDIIQRIVKAGILAPTACNLQPFRIIVASLSESVSKIRDCYKGDWINNARHFIVVVGLVDKAWKREDDGYNSVETDCTIAMDHMILAAANEGLATCWIARFKNTKLRAALELKENEKVFAITPLGYPGEAQKPGKKGRKKLEEIVEFI